MDHTNDPFWIKGNLIGCSRSSNSGPPGGYLAGLSQGWPRGLGSRCRLLKGSKLDRAFAYPMTPETDCSKRWNPPGWNLSTRTAGGPECAYESGTRKRAKPARKMTSAEAIRRPSTQQSGRGEKMIPRRSTTSYAAGVDGSRSRQQLFHQLIIVAHERIDEREVSQHEAVLKIFG